MAVKGHDAGELLREEDALSLLSLEPARNMPDAQKSHLIGQALDELPAFEAFFNRIAEEQAERLLADHRRIREASDASGLRFNVTPALPVDKIGIYVFSPVAAF